MVSLIHNHRSKGSSRRSIELPHLKENTFLDLYGVRGTLYMVQGSGAYLRGGLRLDTKSHGVSHVTLDQLDQLDQRDQC